MQKYDTNNKYESYLEYDSKNEIEDNSYGNTFKHESKSSTIYEFVNDSSFRSSNVELLLLTSTRPLGSAIDNLNLSLERLWYDKQIVSIFGRDVFYQSLEYLENLPDKNVLICLLTEPKSIIMGKCGEMIKKYRKYDKQIVVSLPYCIFSPCNLLIEIIKLSNKDHTTVSGNYIHSLIKSLDEFEQHKPNTIVEDVDQLLTLVYNPEPSKCYLRRGRWRCDIKDEYINPVITIFPDNDTQSKIAYSESGILTLGSKFLPITNSLLQNVSINNSSLNDRIVKIKIILVLIIVIYFVILTWMIFNNASIWQLISITSIFLFAVIWLVNLYVESVHEKSLKEVNSMSTSRIEINGPRRLDA